MVGLFDVLRECLRSGEPAALATVVETSLDGAPIAEPLPALGAKILSRRDNATIGSLGNPDLDKAVLRDALGALETGRSATSHYGGHGERERSEVTVFLQVFLPPDRMVVLGAVDFTAALVKVAKVLGYRVTVCDARPTFATPERFPDADEVVVDWPHRYLAKVAPVLGPRDALCVLTHDHKFDVPAIVTALRTSVGYIGAMGSRHTHAGRVERLRAEGVDEVQLARVMAPIGIDLGANTPEETAVSICAEIIALRTGTPATSLRSGSGPIHRRSGVWGEGL
ncbi:MAG: putative sulfurylase large subunit, molybdopterin cytosine dinucleotide biosynthesis [Acidimicrobiaceae bacterium]|nr:putative sulfurylase large subunit, molybdopterin cytosine dinucleotide biosynthesis [Acidimicrobiaceae bacterium]